MRLLLLQLPALVGVLVGAVATYLTTAAQERSRWRRQQAIRWDERRLAAYSDYAHAVKKGTSIAVRLAATRGVYQDDFWFGGETSEAELIDAEEERTTKWEAVLMLGDEAVVAAAREWHQVMFRLMRLAVGQSSDLTWHEAVHAAGQARGRFYAAVRRDLGVKFGESSEPYEWQMSKWLANIPKDRQDVATHNTVDPEHQG
ncbi:hypothetical protein ACFFKH_26185 [Micromonospora marina]|uniref:DUF4760 domain-containing protein n=1 Tax=Micromonospora marina TaxID=307120 RepID=A0A1C5ALP5_9ACTN|nr:hypothetical protein [Micromonospora marina]SCF46155.1 hypothetical protein GA0070215_14210 [Micromonospora marina]